MSGINMPRHARVLPLGLEPTPETSEETAFSELGGAESGALDAQLALNDPELLAIVDSVGLDVDAARAVLESRSFKAAVDEDWSKSHQYGVTGVPTFVAGGRGVVGAQPYEAIADLLTRAGAAAASAAARAQCGRAWL